MAGFSKKVLGLIFEFINIGGLVFTLNPELIIS